MIKIKQITNGYVVYYDRRGDEGVLYPEAKFFGVLDAMLGFVGELLCSG